MSRLSRYRCPLLGRATMGRRTRPKPPVRLLSGGLRAQRRVAEANSGQYFMERLLSLWEEGVKDRQMGAAAQPRPVAPQQRFRCCSRLTGDASPQGWISCYHRMSG